MIVSSFIEEWLAGRVQATPVSDLRTAARVVLATSHGASRSAVAGIRDLVVATSTRLARDGTWPGHPGSSPSRPA